MAIPLQPASSTTYLQQANGQILFSWPSVVGATSYSVQRSTDGVNWTTVATPSAAQYLDVSVTLGTLYYYQVAAVNSGGTSAYTAPTPVSEVPVVAGTSALIQLRRLAQQRADRLASNFVTVPEWNSYINLAADELYDLITTTYEDYNVYPNPVFFRTTGTQMSYTMPDGVTQFQDASGATIVPPPIYKLAGIDLGLNTGAANGFVTVNKYNFIDRNRYVFPNTSSTIYGVFGLQYRFIGNTVRFIPQPSAGQIIGIWYVPRRTQMLQETDTCDGYGGWNQYIIVRAAKYALDKEESDTTKLDEELLFLKTRIEESAPNRDEGQPDTISDARGACGGGSDGWGGPFGAGW